MGGNIQIYIGIHPYAPVYFGYVRIAYISYIEICYTDLGSGKEGQMPHKRALYPLGVRNVVTIIERKVVLGK